MTEATDSPDADIMVVLNADSGDGASKAMARRISEAFVERGRAPRVLGVSSDDDLGARVTASLDPGLRCVVAAGGDGTICAVAEALSGSDIDLGVIPLGTFNYFARRLGIPTDLEEAVDVICAGAGRTVDLGSVNGRVFINNASLGLYASILEERESIYNRWGRSRAAAYWSVLVAIASVYRPIGMHIEVDGEVRRAKSPMVFVAMSAYQLEKFDIDGARAIREGKFAVLVAPDSGRFKLIWTAMRIAMNGVRSGRDFMLLTGEHVIVETRRSAGLVARDGERERMASPYEFRILRDAIRVRLPDSASTAAIAE